MPLKAIACLTPSHSWDTVGINLNKTANGIVTDAGALIIWKAAKNSLIFVVLNTNVKDITTGMSKRKKVPITPKIIVNTFGVELSPIYPTANPAIKNKNNFTAYCTFPDNINRIVTKSPKINIPK